MIYAIIAFNLLTIVCNVASIVITRRRQRRMTEFVRELVAVGGAS